MKPKVELKLLKLRDGQSMWVKVIDGVVKLMPVIMKRISP